MDAIFQGLSAQAQIMLLVCLLILTAGFVSLLLIVAFYRSAADNICNLFTSLSHLLNHHHVLHIDVKSGEAKQNALPYVEKTDTQD